MRILREPAHVADLVDYVLRTYSIARVRVPIGTIFKLFLGSMLVCFLLCLLCLYTYTCVYTYAPGQDTMGNGHWPCAWALYLQLAIVFCVLYVVFRVLCVVLFYDVYHPLHCHL